VDSQIRPGRIIRASFGPRGAYKPRRPAVVLEEVRDDGTVRVAVGSRNHAEDPQWEVALPEGPGHSRHPVTHLHEPTFIDCSWIRSIHTDQVQEIGGECPGRYMHKITELVEVFDAS